MAQHTLDTRRRFLAAAALLPTGWLVACATDRGAPAPEVSLEGVEPLSGGLLAQRLAVRLRITNPRDTDLTIDGLRAQLDVNDRRLARGVSDARVTIPRLASRTLTVEATASALDVMRQVFGLGADADLSYSLDGTLFLAGDGRRAPVDFDQGGTLRLAAGRGGDGMRLAPPDGR